MKITLRRRITNTMFDAVFTSQNVWLQKQIEMLYIPHIGMTISENDADGDMDGAVIEVVCFPSKQTVDCWLDTINPRDYTMTLDEIIEAHKSFGWERDK